MRRFARYRSALVRSSVVHGLIAIILGERGKCLHEVRLLAVDLMTLIVSMPMGLVSFGVQAATKPADEVIRTVVLPTVFRRWAVLYAIKVTGKD